MELTDSQAAMVLIGFPLAGMYPPITIRGTVSIGRALYRGKRFGRYNQAISQVRASHSPFRGMMSDMARLFLS
ncbi:MAG: hypothetical protein C5B46_07935 [Proteobacteria bacterium]|jgi:hypothetical protein|nr:MAG: hypothetical protein C5B46_07935 [Pseudomonadota bacterium]